MAETSDTGRHIKQQEVGGRENERGRTKWDRKKKKEKKHDPEKKKKKERWGEGREETGMYNRARLEEESSVMRGSSWSAREALLFGTASVHVIRPRAAGSSPTYFVPPLTAWRPERLTDCWWDSGRRGRTPTATPPLTPEELNNSEQLELVQRQRVRWASQEVCDRKVNSLKISSSTSSRCHHHADTQTRGHDHGDQIFTLLSTALRATILLPRLSS